MRLKSLLWSLLTLFAVSISAVGCSDDDPEVEPVNPTPTPPTPPTVLTFDFEVYDVTAHSASFVVTPSTDEESYYTNVLDANAMANKSDADILAMFEGKISDKDLNKGKVEFTVEDMRPDSAYILFAFGYANGNATSKIISKMNFNTEPSGEDPTPPTPSKGPDMYLKTHYEAEIKMMCVDMRCESKDAGLAFWGVLMADAFDEALNSGEITMDIALDPQYGLVEEMSFDELDQLNSVGYTDYPIVAWDPQFSGVKMAVIMKALNTEGTTIVRSDDTMEVGDVPAPPTPGDGPTIKFEGYVNEQNDAVFDAVCTTKNVVSAEIFLNFKDNFEMWLKDVGGDLNAIGDMVSGQGQQFPENWIQEINSDEGTSLKIEDTAPGEVYGAALSVYDAENHRTVAIAYAGDYPGGPIELDFQMVNDGTMNFVLKAKCTSRNASDAIVAFAEPEEMNALVAEFKTFEAVMDDFINLDKCQYFDMEWIGRMNGDEGLEVKMAADPGMKRAFLLDVRNKDSRVVKRSDCNIPGYDGPSYVQFLDEEQFFKLIWNYPVNEQFKYEGDGPCVLYMGDSYDAWCKQLDPVYKEASAEYKDRVPFYQMDINAYPYPFYAMSNHVNAEGRIPVLVTIDKTGKCKLIGGYIDIVELRSHVDRLLLDMPEPTEAPKVNMKAYKINNGVEFRINCPTKNIEEGEILVASDVYFDSLFADYGQDGGAAYIQGQGQPLEYAWIDQLNAGEEVVLKMENIDTYFTYAAVVTVYNKLGSAYSYAVAAEPAPATAAATRVELFNYQPQAVKQNSAAYEKHNEAAKPHFDLSNATKVDAREAKSVKVMTLERKTDRNLKQVSLKDKQDIFLAKLPKKIMK